MKEEIASAQNTQVGKYSIEQALEYFRYCLTIEEEAEELFGLFSPKEYFANKEENNE